MITTINEFKSYLIKENNEYEQNISILNSILSKLDDLKDLDILTSLIEDGKVLTVVHGPGSVGGKIYDSFHTELIPKWIDSLWMDRLKSDGQSMNEIYNYDKQFTKWIQEKGYESQEVFLAYIPGRLNSHNDSENFSDIDVNDLENSINKLVSEIKNYNIYEYSRGHFRMGYDVFSNKEEENPGWALFMFKDSTRNGIIEAQFGGYISYNNEENIEVIFQPNTSLFYSFKPGGPYGSRGENPMVDLCSEEGYSLRLD